MDHNTQPCRGCGKPILWAALADVDGKLVVNENGSPKCIPLDPRAPVYHVRFFDDGRSSEADRAPDTFVSHFATCPAANQFSGSSKKQSKT